MNRRLFLAAGLAGTLFPSRGSMATTAQVSAQTESHRLIAEAVTEDVERLLKLMMVDGFGGGWNTDRGLAMAQNVHIASLIIDDDDYNRLLDDAIASAGGEGAFMAQIVINGPEHLEQELQARGVNLLESLRYMSFPEVRSALDDLRNNGFSSFLAGSAASIRRNCDEDPEQVALCRRLRDDMDAAETAALIACGVSGTGSTLRRLLRLHAAGRIVLALGCLVAIGVYVTAWVQYHAEDCDSHL